MLMSQINVTNLTFSYEGSFDDIFENVSFSIDTDWKLGFIGRNGKGKTTFLRLLSGDYAYQGSIGAARGGCGAPLPPISDTELRGTDQSASFRFVLRRK